LLVQRGLADLTVRVAGGAQFIIGSVLQRQEGVIGTRQCLQDLIELALDGTPLPRKTSDPRT
jgi:hypothetical protein